MAEYKDFLDCPEDRVKEAAEIKERLVEIIKHIDYYIEMTAAPHELIANHPRFLHYMIRYLTKLKGRVSEIKQQYRP